MTTKQIAEFLFGDGEQNNPPSQLGSDEKRGYEELRQAVSACDNLDHDGEFELDPSADDPLPDFDSDRKVA